MKNVWRLTAKMHFGLKKMQVEFNHPWVQQSAGLHLSNNNGSISHGQKCKHYKGSLQHLISPYLLGLIHSSNLYSSDFICVSPLLDLATHVEMRKFCMKCLRNMMIAKLWRIYRAMWLTRIDLYMNWNRFSYHLN